MLLIESLSEIGTIIFTASDLVWDLIALVVIIYYQGEEDGYTTEFMYAYIAVVFIGLIVNVSDSFMRSKNVIEQTKELKRGVNILENNQIQNMFGVNTNAIDTKSTKQTGDQINDNKNFKRSATSQKRQAKHIQSLSNRLTMFNNNDLSLMQKSKSTEDRSKIVATTNESKSKSKLGTKNVQSVGKLELNKTSDSVSTTTSETITPSKGSEFEDSYLTVYGDTAKLLAAQTRIDRYIHSASMSIFVAIFECLPIAILNIYSILGLKTFSVIIFLSTLSSAVSGGYKLSDIKILFLYLEEKRNVAEKLNIALKLQHQLRKEVENSETSSASSSVTISRRNSFVTDKSRRNSLVGNLPRRKSLIPSTQNINLNQNHVIEPSSIILHPTNK